MFKYKSYILCFIILLYFINIFVWIWNIKNKILLIMKTTNNTKYYHLKYIYLLNKFILKEKIMQTK